MADHFAPTWHRQTSVFSLPDPEKKRAIPEFKKLVENVGFRTVRWDNKDQGLYVGIRDAVIAL
jgi:hypothetical protein